MKQRHKAVFGAHCRAILQMINASVNQDFHTLSSAQVEMLLKEADRVKYQKPPNANGSRARYFFARIVRGARQ